MASGTPRTTYFTSRTVVAYAIAYVLAAGSLGLGYMLRSVSWLALGLWLAASLSVILIDRAVVERAPRGNHEADGSVGAMFQGSPAALTVIGIMAAAALVVSFLVSW
ncbi:hypothetical protein [Archangium sp.]|uniref:hypothetical protein n=1 Tax=Archangium sp. TaxID=1872627 RepID=UPI003899BE72